MQQCVSLVFVLATLSLGSAQICGNLCDNDDSGRLTKPHPASTVEIFSRQISVQVSDTDNAAFGRIENGDQGDQVWIDRSWTGGRSWDDGSRLGNNTIPNNARDINTPVFNIDGNFESHQIGVLRACGKPGNSDEIACTEWTRAAPHSSNPAEAAATALMMDYNDRGQWDTTGWWNAANCLTAIIDYMKVTGDRTYLYAIDNTFEKNKNEFQGFFRNEYLDDTGWWALAWVGAYDLTGDQKYLNTAKITADFMYEYSDDFCEGGVYRSTTKTNKDAITNELFIKLTAAIHNRIPGDTKYLDWSIQFLQWFQDSGMINNGSQINDGIDASCQSSGAITWTYNQGVLLGGFVELAKATGDNSYLDRARQIGDASVSSNFISPNGILHEPCDHWGISCGDDAPSFKGGFARNFGELNAALSDRPYSQYITRNADTIHYSRNSIDQYGLHYEGPFEFHTAATQHSALDMLTAARRIY